MWGNALFLLKHDLKRVKFGLIGSALMYVYFSVLSGMLSDEWFGVPPGQAKPNISFALDLMFLTSMSCIGFFFTADYQRYRSGDIFTKRLLFLRTFPIEIRELVVGRMLQMTVNIGLMSALFFPIFYAISELGSRFSWTECVSFALLWISFGICAGTVWIYKEMTGMGASYFWFCLLFVLFFIALAGLARLIGFGFLVESVRLVEGYGLAVPAVGLPASAAWAMLWMRALERRIRTREYLR